MERGGDEAGSIYARCERLIGLCHCCESSTSIDRRISLPPIVPVHHGRRLLVKFPLVSPSLPTKQLPYIPLNSKRWIVDRATLKQARAEDMRYVKDPLFFQLFNIFTGNRAAVFRLPPPMAERRY